MPSIKTIINSHNRKIISETKVSNETSCNCVTKENCPLQENCLAANNLYQATVTSSTPNFGEKVYVGVCEPPFKSRFNVHKSSFNNKKYETSTKLSREIWKLKEKGDQYSISWKIIKHSPGYNPVSKRCLLCLNEKLHIAEYKSNNLLNTRDELVSKCRHQNKFLLRNCDSKD